MRGRALALVAALGLLPACGDDDTDATPASTPVTASPSAEAKVVNDIVKLASGQKLSFYCTGPPDNGKGTILLEAGGGSGSEDWPAEIFQGLSDGARVCAYDRAGTGSSGAAPNRNARWPTW